MRATQEIKDIAAGLISHLQWLLENGEREIPGKIPASSAPSTRVSGGEACAPAPKKTSLRATVRAAVGKQPMATVASTVGRSTASNRAQAMGSQKLNAVDSPLAGAELNATANRAAKQTTAPVVSPTAKPIVNPMESPVVASPSTKPIAEPMESPAVKWKANGVTKSTLAEVEGQLSGCQRCKLGLQRKNPIFGAGNPQAKLVLVCDSPGEAGENRGMPIAGAGGQLLIKMIEAMGLSRDDVYLCNVIKCPISGDRHPEPDEVEACQSFLQAQLACLNPTVIVSLGELATRCLLGDAKPIARLRGQWRDYQGIKVMPTFHPAYLARRPSEKGKTWEDLKEVMLQLKKSKT